MANLEGFDASQVEPNEGFTPVPAGSYDAIITASKMVPTKAGDGQFLELTFQIMNGPQQNRTVIDRLNLVNQNTKAVEIAKGNLSAICRAVNVLTPGDSSELHNKPLIITEKIREGTDGRQHNEVSGYKKRGSVATDSEPLVSQQSEQPAGVGASPF